MNILADASLPGLNEAFPAPFNLIKYQSDIEVPSLLSEQDILLCRSTLKVNATLLKNSQLQFVATASSGTDHLDQNHLKANNIQMIDAKGCNATSVADYLISCLAYLGQNNLLKGKKAGIIGMGKVGSEVYNRLKTLDFQIVTYDPLKAEREPLFVTCSLSDLSQCDIICIHAELHNTTPYPSFNLINSDFLSQLKPNCIIINAARGGIVNEQDLLNTQQPLVYCTDVYLNEPAIDKAIIEKATLCTPHIAGHSLEAKYAAVSLVSQQLHYKAGLPVPVFAKPYLPTDKHQLNYKSWEEIALSLYNPINETLILKNALDKRAGYLSLRKSHQNRHDFKAYYESIVKTVPLIFS